MGTHGGLEFRTVQRAHGPLVAHHRFPHLICATNTAQQIEISEKRKKERKLRQVMGNQTVAINETGEQHDQPLVHAGGDWRVEPLQQQIQSRSGGGGSFTTHWTDWLKEESLESGACRACH